MLPRSLVIGPHRYRIRNANVRELGKDVCADVDNTKNLIRVNRKAKGSRKIELILHEAMHAMLAGHQFEEEEAIVVILGERITQLLADNKDFVEEMLRILWDAKKT